MAYRMLMQLLPDDIVDFCIAPMLMPSEETVRSNHETTMKELRELPGIKLPFRAIVTGKKNLTVSVLKHLRVWDRIILISSRLNQPIYRHLIERIKTLEQIRKRRILEFDLPAIDSFPYHEAALVIVDYVPNQSDCANRIKSLWIRGRLRGVSSILISDSYTGIPKDIKQNSDYVFMHEHGTLKDLTKITRESGEQFSVQEIKTKHDQVDMSRSTNFFLFDKYNRDGRYRFRTCFAPMD